jgi:ABC-type transport system involved in multi-copper enzyme maturation permease subunit
MIWLAWRQFRTQVLTALAATAVLAILFAITGPGMVTRYTDSGVAGCQGADCMTLASNFLTELHTDSIYPILYELSIALILFTPAIIGVFWGAPLIAREVETGTDRLAWNQGVTRTRWLAVKLMLTGLAAMAVTEGLSLMQAWWAAPIGRAVGVGGTGPAFSSEWSSGLIFASHGITPLGYAAFAFVLGVTCGALIRRSIPAMAVTLAIFAVVQIAVPLFIRPNLFPASHTTITAGRDISFTTSTQGSFALTTGSLPGQPDAWVLSSGAVDATGHPVSTIPSACTQAVLNGSGASGLDCLANEGIRIAVAYEPASRDWPLQWAETGIYLALALILAGCCFWRLRPPGGVRSRT